MSQYDIAQAAEIDREAFPTQWPPPNYRHELEFPLAHYLVAVLDGDWSLSSRDQGQTSAYVFDSTLGQRVLHPRGWGGISKLS